MTENRLHPFSSTVEPVVRCSSARSLSDWRARTTVPP